MIGKLAVEPKEFEFSFHLPTLIEFGYGKAARLGERLLQLDVRKVFIVSDKGVASAGLLTAMTESLRSSGITFDLYTDVEPDPGLETIDRGAAAFRTQPYDGIVAVGGGSSIDAAKGIRAVAANGGSIGDYAGVNRIPAANPVPLIAIPTTSGTGSEVTIFGVYSDWHNQVKVTVTSQHMAPTIALVDPELTMNLPARMTAASGIDALAHGIETFFSVRSRPASDALAMRAIAAVSANLRRAVHDGSDIEARIGMSHGSLLAGMAFNNGFLGLAHAIGSALSGHCHVPHGVAIGLLLPSVVEFNASVRPEKAATIAQLMVAIANGAGTKAEGAASAVDQMVRDIGLPTRLRDVGVPEEKLTDIARDSFKSGMMKFNPRTPTEHEVLELLEGIF
ncbi:MULTISPECIES: iron-containing alcohol dehydrogenase family protein [Paenibacillus]|uniref:Acetaldehyde dehydrogenase n=1 Tax=Paenibacillus naphthalenovorans TaxID=162209 RepID=A0A0U2M794_9BACL|nr:MULTISPECIES: iron-containing alcohol dehydrogenase [Paenibacillus]ALS23984.1 acetaldehyde dehydrogenase [Paenibacillus naphthalenovorans]GCL72213.1 NAD-dependent alcohol dehydrogenase [Paenibacillus naphthalenovorans]